MTEDNSVSYKALTVHEFHSFIMRQYEAGIIDENKKDITINAEGLLATCIQHEIDHLNGILFIDHLSKLKREMMIFD